MITGKYNIIAPQGSTYRLTFVISTDGIGWNLSTYTARMQVRSATNSATTILDLSSTTGDITLDSVGSVTVTVPAEADIIAPFGLVRIDTCLKL